MNKKASYKCPRCEFRLLPAEAWNGAQSEFWYECENCNTFYNSYRPMPHQAAVHTDSHRYILNAGGYGTGKTTTTREEFEKHMILTPNGEGLIGAKVTPMYEQTIQRELNSDIPKAFVKGWSQQKQYMDFINNYRLRYRPLDDEGKLRSMNLDFWAIIEASEAKASTFHQLKTRLRKLTAIRYEKDAKGNIIYDEDDEGRLIPRVKHDWRKGIVETNPDPGWVMADVLEHSEQITLHSDSIEDLSKDFTEPDNNIASHLASTDCNYNLPPGFIEEISKNKPDWWVRRYIYSSFKYSEGLVYPTALNWVTRAFPIPRDWIRVAAFDYGLSDNAHMLFGAIDTKHGILYIYAEEVNDNKDIEYLAKVWKSATSDIPNGGFYTTPWIDPKSGPKRDYQGKRLMDHLLDYGLAFQPGTVSIETRVLVTNTMFENGQIRVFDTCPVLIDELKKYKFPERSLDKNVNANKPIDKDNHGINPLEWICTGLPRDLKNIYRTGYYNGDPMARQRQVEKTIWQLQDVDHGTGGIEQDMLGGIEWNG